MPVPALHVRPTTVGRIIGATGLLVFTGCTQPPAPAAPTATVAIASGTVTINAAALTFDVDIPQTAEQQRVGLSRRPHLKRGSGMLFRFSELKPHQVWMAGMTYPLDIAWIAHGKVAATDTLLPCDEADESRCPRTDSPGAVDALLEVPANSLTAVTPGMDVAVVQHP